MLCVGTDLDIDHELPDEVHTSRDSGQVAKAAALHVEHDDVPFRQPVLGDPHIVEGEERLQTILKNQLGGVRVSQLVQQDLVALGSRLGQGRHQTVIQIVRIKQE